MEEANARFKQNPCGGVALNLLARYDYNRRWMFTSGFGLTTYGFEYSLSENYSLRQGQVSPIASGQFGVIEVPTMVFYKFSPNCRSCKLIVGAGIVQTLIGKQSGSQSYMNAEANTNGNYLKSEHTANEALVSMLRFSFGHEKVMKKGGIMSVTMLFNLGLTELATSNVSYKVDGQEYQHSFSNTGNFIGIRMNYYLRPLGQARVKSKT